MEIDTLPPQEMSAKHAQSPKKTLRLIVFSWFCLFLFTYIAVSPFVARAFYYRMLFQSVAYPYGYYEKTEVAGITAKDVNFKSLDGSLLHGWYFKVPNSKYVILMHHGNGGNLSILGWYADLAIKSGASIMLYDYRGYGKSKGTPSWTGVCQDAEAAYDYLVQNEGWQPKQLINMGLSLGTGAASNLSSKKECAGTVLIAPYVSLRGLCSDILPWLRAYPPQAWPEDDIGSEGFLSHPHPPVLILHGNEDELVPIANSYKLKQLSSSALELVELKCGHGDLGREHDLILSSIRGFIDRLCAHTEGPKASELHISRATHGVAPTAEVLRY